MAQCWIARSDAIANTSPETRQLAGLMRKILQRGGTPPLHPAAERSLLERAGLGPAIAESTFPGDLNVKLTQDTALPAFDPRSYWANDAAPESDPGLRFDSQEERDFYTEWLPQAMPGSTRWTIPQVSFGALTGEREYRRVDFLVSPPLAEPFVVEIDGFDHDKSIAVDEDRDALLAAAGLDVLRIPADQFRVRAGQAMEAVKARLGSASAEPPATLSDSEQLLAYGPIELHRLVTALIEAVAAGFVKGERWQIEVKGSSAWAGTALIHYLNLLLALDRIWSSNVAPNEILIALDDDSVSLTAEQNGYQRAGSKDPISPDVTITLQPERSPTEPMPVGSTTPQIVVRSAYLPAMLADEAFGGGARPAPPNLDLQSLHWPLREVLAAVFAKSDFREGQLEAIVETIHGRDCAVLLPTGAGKSLIYQLAGLCTPGRTIVVDPLVSLMEDQVAGLQAHGIERVATFSAFETMRGRTSQLLEDVASGHALFVFISPERLQQLQFRNSIRELAQVEPINLAVIDEAHCVSEWGHDFRTAYLNLGAVLRDVGRDTAGTPPALLALTGTASRAVLKDVLFELGISLQSENTIIRPKSFDREELRYSITRVEPREAEAALGGLVRALPAQFNMSAAEFFAAREDNTYSGIVFCPHVNGAYGVVSVAKQLDQTTGQSTAIYAGGPPRGFERETWENTKRQNAQRFKENDVAMLVSTKAFGMGIDKPNIRYVIHFGLPSSIESYYQEVGRGGRDRQRAECALLLVEYDEDRDRQMLAEEASLEDARQSADAVSRMESDDITRQLFFHFNSFQGIDEELDAVEDVLAEVDDLGRRQSIEIPFGDDARRRERGIHRLVVLGVVRDYLVEWGSRKFSVELNKVAASDVIESYADYVRRNQPQRLDIEQDNARAHADDTVGDAVMACAELLIRFVYDTVEKSRRRSLREMWLASRETVSDPNGAFRQRILDYLTQGDITPVLESLIDRRRLDLSDWTTELQGVIGLDEARELRGSAARLLASYPDHPGLLLARGLSEAIDPDGDLSEFVSNVSAAIESALGRYAVDEEAVGRMGEWLLEYCKSTGDGVVTAATIALAPHLATSQLVAEIRRRALTDPTAEPGLRVLGLTDSLETVAADLGTLAGRLDRRSNT